jgi:hypothetical protein
MSSTAFFHKQDSTVLLSDGIAIRVDGLDPEGGIPLSVLENRVVSRNYKKVFKLNDHTGGMWTGSGIELIDRFTRLCTPKDNALDCGKILVRLIKGSNQLMSLMGEKWFNINVHLFGYVGKQLYVSQVTCELTPGHTFIKEGACGVMVPFTSQNESNLMFMKAANEVGNDANNCKAKFERMLELFQAKDKLVGGTVFKEVIVPRE